MMVLSALYISVSTSLPGTAYVKYVEIWLLGSLIYPFVIVIIQTYVHVHRTGSGRMGKRARFIRIMINDKPVDKTATADWSRETECKNKANAAMYVGKLIVPLVATTLGLLYWVIGLMNKYV